MFIDAAGTDMLMSNASTRVFMFAVLAAMLVNIASEEVLSMVMAVSSFLKKCYLR